MTKNIAKYLNWGYLLLFVVNIQTALADGMVPAGKPDNLPEGDDFAVALTRVIDFFLGLVGVVAVLMLVVAGLRYIMSGGKDETIQKAKNSILYAVIGIIVVVISYAAVHTLTSGIGGE